jgi:hypothetical protein
MTYKRKLRILWSIISAVTISACGAGSPGALPGSNASNAEPPPSSSQTFHFTRTAQKFKVPSRVTQLTITVDGAVGGGYKNSGSGYPGALGAAVKAAIPVRPGQMLIVLVGSKGIKGGANGGGGGFNGGGPAFVGAFGGGGSSDVRTAGAKLADRILVAGGGGGSGETGLLFSCHGSSCSGTGNSYPLFGGAGGVGGWTAGGDGATGDQGGGGGGGGTQQSGGAGGVGRSGSSISFSSKSKCKAVDGRKGKLLNAGEGAAPFCGSAAGGGGGGYYGGGGGGGGGYEDRTATGTIYSQSGGGGGGGGGSSFVEASATHVHRAAGGGPNGDGVIIISW